MAMYKTGQRILCPCCDELLDGVVEDFTVAGLIGPESENKEQCGGCDGWFSVTQITDGNFEVVAIDDEDDDDD